MADADDLVVTFVHLTDLHIETFGSRPYGVDTEARLRRICGWIRDAGIRPSFYLITGDLSDSGSADAYRRLRRVLAEELDSSAAPVLLALGNHDDRESFVGVFSEFAERSAVTNRICYSADVAGLRVVVLDSLVRGRVDGELGAEQLAWLDGELADGEGRQVVAVHHPLVPRGIPRAEDYLLADRDEMAAVIERHDVLAVLCGHSHVATTATVGGTLHVAGPATAYLLDPTMRAGSRGLDAGGFVVATVRGGRLVVNPVIVDGDGQELFAGAN